MGRSTAPARRQRGRGDVGRSLTLVSTRSSGRSRLRAEDWPVWAISAALGHRGRPSCLVPGPGVTRKGTQCES